LHAGGFTERVLHPSENHTLIESGIGITNVVARTTRAASDLSDEELRRGVQALRRKVTRYRPRFLAVLGMQAYRIGFGATEAGIGEQDERIGDTRVWLLPNPSGLNAHYQLPELGAEFARLRRAAGLRQRGRPAKDYRPPR
jgi:double-stranded uracil-DNA glycosylase